MGYLFARFSVGNRLGYCLTICFQNRGGLLGRLLVMFTWLFTLDHKRIGMIYMVLGIWGGFLGLSLRMLIRLNYLDPYYNIVSSEVYNYVITKHGVAMIFFFLMPVLIGGFGNYLLPLLLGIPDLNLPRLKALRAWLMLPSAVCLGLRMLGGAGVG